MVTIGIAGPWGECMFIRYKVNHTVLNGKRMNFNGTGGEYFVEKFKWIFFTIITLGIYGFWIPIKKTKWIISHIYFEDEGFIKEESYFDGKLIQFIGINILCCFLNCVSFGILYAFTMCFKQKWLAKHTIINRKRIVISGRALNLIGKYLLWVFLIIITFGIFGLWLGIKLTKWEVKNTHIKVAGETEENKENPIIMIIVSVVVAIIGIIIISNIIPVITSGNVPALTPSSNVPNSMVENVRY